MILLALLDILKSEALAWKVTALLQTGLGQKVRSTLWGSLHSSVEQTGTAD